MTSMLEIAARALYDEEFGSHGSDTDFQDMHDYWKRSALAVLKAIREPDEGMIAAAWSEIASQKKAAGIGKLGPGPGFAQIWRTGIDHIIGEAE